MSQRYKGGIISATPPTTSSVGYGSGSGIWTRQQQMQLAASGAWPGPFTPIESMFSTYLYNGAGGSQTITNGIDLSGQGGLVWIKRRSPSSTSVIDHCLTDTVRGQTKYISSNTTTGDTTRVDTITSFNDNGFTIGSADIVNKSGDTVVAWTFRKQPKFFDIVTYTGTGTTLDKVVSHNLGSTPGCVIIKSTSTSGSWFVGHRGSGSYYLSNELILNSTAGGATNTVFGSAFTSTTITVTGNANVLDRTYVVYLFAHDAGGFGTNNSENGISCGEFTSSTSANVTVTLGYEPQWILMKPTSTSGAWFMFDNMRGMANSTATGADRVLLANSSTSEDTTNYSGVYPTSTGFIVNTNFASTQLGNGVTTAYIAIRRGPMAPPTSGTQVYIGAYGTGSSNPAWISGFPIDMAIDANIGGGSTDEKNLSTRLAQQRYLVTNTTAAEAAYSAELYDYQNGFRTTNNGTSDFAWMFRRYPYVFDLLYYTGTGSNLVVSHNLKTTPELMIVKSRGAAEWWALSSAYPDAGTGAGSGYGVSGNNNILYFNQAFVISNGDFLYALPTATTFTVSPPQIGVNGTGYIALLFATLAGVSKVGIYTGTGSILQINCGFSGGVRFLLIKRVTGGTGDWYLWDSTRGISSGNDPYTLLNTNGGEVTNVDWVDSYNPGFELSDSVGNNVNINGSIYFYLALA